MKQAGDAKRDHGSTAYPSLRRRKFYSDNRLSLRKLSYYFSAQAHAILDNLRVQLKVQRRLPTSNSDTMRITAPVDLKP